MPKGALLHAHMEATVDAASLLKMALEHSNMCIRAPATLTTDTLDSTLPDFAVRPVGGNYDSAATITSQNYVPNTYVSAQKVRSEWPETLGGPKGFDAWVVRSLVINPSEAYNTHNTTVKIWDKFKSCFTVIRVGVVDEHQILHLTLLRESRVLLPTSQSSESFSAVYSSLVLRMGLAMPNFVGTSPPSKTPYFRLSQSDLFCRHDILTSEDGAAYIDHDRLVSIFQTELELYLESLRLAGRSDDFHGAKVRRIVNWLYISQYNKP